MILERVLTGGIGYNGQPSFLYVKFFRSSTVYYVSRSMNMHHAHVAKIKFHKGHLQTIWITKFEMRKKTTDMGFHIPKI